MTFEISREALTAMGDSNRQLIMRTLIEHCGTSGLRVGEIQKNTNISKDGTMNVMSVTKSVMSLLVGIAIDQGLIKSVDDFVVDYYKEIYTPKRREKTIYKVTIKHLITMTAPYKGKSEPWTEVCTSEDWTLTTLDVLGGVVAKVSLMNSDITLSVFKSF